jgi:flagellar M-ring protein FliF
MDESYGSNSGKVGGAAGVPGTIRPGTATVTSTGDKGGYSRTQTTARYQVSKTITHKITAPGQVENMSVAVMVDDTVTESKNAAIQRAVATAAGIDEARGDKITVERIAFDNSTFKKEEKEMQAMAKQSSLVSYGKMIGGVLLLVGFLFFLKGLLKQVNISVPESVRVQEVPISEVAALQGYDSPQTARVGAEPQIVTEQKPVSTLPNMAQSQPEDIAQVLRKWMADS